MVNNSKEESKHLSQKQHFSIAHMHGIVHVYIFGWLPVWMHKLLSGVEEGFLFIFFFFLLSAILLALFFNFAVPCAASKKQTMISACVPQIPFGWFWRFSFFLLFIYLYLVLRFFFADVCEFVLFVYCFNTLFLRDTGICN